MLLALASFVAGVITVFSPCTLPFLPLILGQSFDGKNNYRKALVVIVSVSLSIFIFTFLLKYSTALIQIPNTFWSYLSGTIITLFGLSYVFPKLFQSQFLDSVRGKIDSYSKQKMSEGRKKKNIWGDILIGASLGPIFSTCSPTYFIILASVLPVSLGLGVVYILIYILAIAVTLFILVALSQNIFSKYIQNIQQTGTTATILGIIFIVIGISVMAGYDKKVEVKLTEFLPDITKIEQRILNAGDKNSLEEKKETERIQTPLETSMKVSANKITQSENNKNRVSTTQDEKNKANINGFINTSGEKIDIQSEVGNGKVVLVSIWTYGCINCQRTLPYLNRWYDSYKDKGLEIISVHTPEFAYEKKQENVEAFALKNKIEYPIIMDNDFAIWNSFNNRYWPRKFLYDKNGVLIMDVIGEGQYDEMEQKIIQALAS